MSYTAINNMVPGYLTDTKKGQFMFYRSESRIYIVKIIFLDPIGRKAKSRFWVPETVAHEAD
jgi:hypothetical protein